MPNPPLIPGKVLPPEDPLTVSSLPCRDIMDLVGEGWGEKEEAEVGGRPRRDGWRVRLCVGVPADQRYSLTESSAGGLTMRYQFSLFRRWRLIWRLTSFAVAVHDAFWSQWPLTGRSTASCRFTRATWDFKLER